MPDNLFRPGENCAAVARADRVAFIVDAEDYFDAFMHAAEHAERSIVILAWDFDSRTPLCNDDDPDKCVTVGKFLNCLAKRKPHLRIRILDWDFPMVFGTDRELPPSLNFSWKPHKHLDFRFDDTHPVGGSHHQKIIVIDDKLAFSGGLDLTNKRWDTREHKAEDPLRVFDGKPYPPFHDVMIAVDAEAAKALSKVASERWLNATGETLKPVWVDGDPWPPELPVHVTDVQVSIACTVPDTDTTRGVHHVEASYLDMIARARDYIYIENQYFTSRTIGAALAKRLAEPDGPEVLVVTRLLSHGWLEEVTMTALRTRLVRELRAADRHGRLNVMYPDVPGLCEGTCLDIHSKVMIVDDEWLRIGSANLSNRSMGMDTECDVTIEAEGGATVKEVIREFRDCLIAEHVGGEVEDVARAVKGAGTMAGAIAKLARRPANFASSKRPSFPKASSSSRRSAIPPSRSSRKSLPESCRPRRRRPSRCARWVTSWAASLPRRSPSRLPGPTRRCATG
jgi:phosphatidylserine/phosphatidylglycerophosphate/cardiolipin synthase-like enzyme